MQISDLFSGHLPDNIDAALQWGGFNYLYFFKGSQYWKFFHWPYLASGYPRNISDWGGIPSNIDAAFQSKNGETYFFKSGSYWKLNYAKGGEFVRTSVETANPPYPRDVGKWWFGCP